MTNKVKEEVADLLEKSHKLSFEEGFIKAWTIINEMTPPESYTNDAKVFFRDTKRSMEKALTKVLVKL